MIKNSNSRLSKKKGKSNANQSPTKNPQADFTPTITDVTREGQCFVIVGGAQPPKPKADFEPEVTDITEEGNFEVWVKVPQPPQKT
jgi:hypothetical protein